MNFGRNRARTADVWNTPLTPLGLLIGFALILLKEAAPLALILGGLYLSITKASAIPAAIALLALFPLAKASDKLMVRTLRRFERRG